jgi:hypothetical protein
VARRRNGRGLLYEFEHRESKSEGEQPPEFPTAVCHFGSVGRRRMSLELKNLRWHPGTSGELAKLSFEVWWGVRLRFGAHRG